MKYEVIARRYRPRKFEEVVGQESIARTLLGGIVQDRLAHAYLFAGPRGVGKTSMARIFAKAINCPAAASRERDPAEWGRPCDECSVCTAIHAGQDIDVLELDGASHRGIEDIRGLIEGVNRPATRGGYKVYLVDEVHMLTREAFNALLKTLEEPPPHVKFIFATTEPYRIPDTVLSRCQRFDFKPISEDDIVRRLEQICQTEERTPAPGLLLKIARSSKGGLRDSQTLLDQLMTYAEGELTEADLDRLTGRVGAASIDTIYTGLITREPRRVLDAVRESFAGGADPSILIEQVVERLHEAIRESILADGEATPHGASGASIDRLIGSLQVLLRTASDLRTSAYPDIAVEVALLKLTRLEDPRALDRALERLASMARHAGEGVRPARAPGDPGGDEASARGSRGGAPRAGMPPAASYEPPRRPPLSTPEARAARGTGPQSGDGPAVAVAEPVEVSCDFGQLQALWEQIAIELRREHPGVSTFLENARLEEPRDGGRPQEFVIRFTEDFHYAQLKMPHRLKVLEEVVQEVTRAPWRARPELGPAPPRPQGAGSPGASERRSSLPVEAPSAPPRRSRAGGGLADEAVVKKAIEVFNGRLV